MVDQLQRVLQVRSKELAPELVVAGILGKVMMDNQTFASAVEVVSTEMKEKKEVSFGALDLLGVSFNTLRDPMNIKTAGEYHKKLEKQYAERALAALDAMFVSSFEVSLAEVAAQAKPTIESHKLTNKKVFEQLDGHFAERLQQQAVEE